MVEYKLKTGSDHLQTGVAFNMHNIRLQTTGPSNIHKH